MNLQFVLIVMLSSVLPPKEENCQPEIIPDKCLETKSTHIFPLSRLLTDVQPPFSTANSILDFTPRKQCIYFPSNHQWKWEVKLQGNLKIDVSTIKSTLISEAASAIASATRCEGKFYGGINGETVSSSGQYNLALHAGVDAFACGNVLQFTCGNILKGFCPEWSKTRIGPSLGGADVDGSIALVSIVQDGKIIIEPKPSIGEPHLRTSPVVDILGDFARPLLNILEAGIPQIMKNSLAASIAQLIPSFDFDIPAHRSINNFGKSRSYLMTMYTFGVDPSVGPTDKILNFEHAGFVTDKSLGFIATGSRYIFAATYCKAGIYDVQQTIDFLNDDSPGNIRVASGDSLWSLSDRYYGAGWHWPSLARWNRIMLDRLTTGTTLLIPRPSELFKSVSASVVVEPSMSLWKIWKAGESYCKGRNLELHSWEELFREAVGGSEILFPETSAALCRESP